MSHRAAHRLTAAALLVPSTLTASRDSPLSLVAALAVLLVLLGGVLGGRARWGALAQWVAQAVVSALVAWALLLVVGSARGRLGEWVSLVALSIAVPRLLLRTGRVGLVVTHAAGLLALMGLARAVSRPVFGVGVSLYLLLALAAAMALAPGWPRRGVRAAGWWAPQLLAVGIAGAVMGVAAWGLPIAEPMVSQALEPYLTPSVAASGFGDGRIQLGDFRRIVSRDEVALRVFGEVDHLRGDALVHYRRGSWFAEERGLIAKDVAREGALTLGGGATAAPLRVEAMPRSGARYFTPLAAAELRGVPNGITLDGAGVVRLPEGEQDALRVWALVPGDPARRRIAPPGAIDVVVPSALAEGLASLARGWVADAEPTPAAQIEALRRRLSTEFTYTTEPGEVPRGVDPTWHFLSTSRAGHCEYFASGLVLLARALEVPARVITGYRVLEFNQLGGYWVVRHRDAHAWVEVYYEGRWWTVDPTPEGVLPGENAAGGGWMGELVDLLKRAWQRIFDRLAEIRLLDALVATVGVGLLLAAWIGLRRRRRRRGPRAVIYPPLAHLEREIARGSGLRRAPSETLARFAERLRAEGLASAAGLVDRCAARIYGAPEDAAVLETLDRELTEAVASAELRAGRDAQPSTRSR